MAKVITFGEIMLRLKSPAYERFFQSPVLEATFGGGEANVAVSLANYGIDTAFVTVLPKLNEVIGRPANGAVVLVKSLTLAAFQYTVFSPVHPLNAPVPTVVTRCGIVTEVMPVLFSNARSAMLVT